MVKASKKKSQKKKEKKNIPHGIVNIIATFNNTILTVSDPEGKVLSWSSTGIHGFKGSKKSTPYAARLVGEDVMKKAMEHGLKSVDVNIKGPGTGRESALRAIGSSGIKINLITDITPIPHNGCRPPKRRRI